MRTPLILALTLAATALAAPAKEATPQATDYLHANATTGEEACKIFSAWFADNWLTRTPISPFVAQLCLFAMPFDRQEATTLLTETRLLGDFLSLVPHAAHAPLSWLEMPPYNINASFEAIEDAVTSPMDGYKDMYTFYLDLFRTFGLFQDGHTSVTPKCVSLLYYYHDYPIVNLGDEIWTVKIEKTDTDGDGTVDMKIDKRIKKINGKDVLQYLAELTSSQRGMVQLQDPDARWNNLMARYPAIKFQEEKPLPEHNGEFAYRAEWYYGVDEMVIEFEGGEKVEVEWKATSDQDVSDESEEKGSYTFSTPQELLDNVCMMPALTSEEPEETELKKVSGRAWTKDDESSNDIIGYPDPISRGPEDLAMVFLDSTDPTNTTAVLRLSSFLFERVRSTDDDYYSHITQILPQLKSEGIKRLIIDISSNTGGISTYAKVIRQTLFPSSPDLHTPGRLKWNQLQDDQLAPLKLADFKLQEFRTPEGAYFASPRALLGPYNVHKSQFFALASLDYETEPLGDLDLPEKDLWKKEDVVIISNGLCHSTCHTFVEAMTHRDVGVRAFSLGGRPGNSPMQPVGGTKGGTNRDIEAIDDMLMNTGRETFSFKTMMTLGMVNIEDQYRDNDDDGDVLPLQFRWTPGCGVVKHTRKTVEDVREVWAAVRRMAWEEDGKARECVHEKMPRKGVKGGDSEDGGEGEGEMDWLGYLDQLDAVRITTQSGKLNGYFKEEEEEEEEEETKEKDERKEDEKKEQKEEEDESDDEDEDGEFRLSPNVRIAQAILKGIRH